MAKYVMALDAGTTSNRCILFDEHGTMCSVAQKEFTQYFPKPGWVEHDANEIWSTQLGVAVEAMSKIGASAGDIAAIGITNQRETVAAWNRKTGTPIYHGIVWQCPRGEAICGGIKAQGYSRMIKERTGLELSPYFSASKLAWLLQNVPEAVLLAETGDLCCGTIDSWLVFQLTGGTAFKTDYSNASRTQLLNIHSLKWDEEICGIFGIPTASLPEICDSDSIFGMTSMDGLFEKPIPISCVMGDSNGALFGQGCHELGMAKATYGTGSSVMMNVGRSPVVSEEGLATSLAWSRGGEVHYVLEGNINYTGAVITWLQKQLRLIDNAAETESLAMEANPRDKTYIVPAFTGLGAPYWNSEATALVTGVTRMTGKPEFVKAGLECIAYQIRDVLERMDRGARDLNRPGLTALRVDGGPTKNRYLMQFQADILGILVEVPEDEELSGIGVAYMAGISLGFFDSAKLFDGKKRKTYAPQMGAD